MSKRKTDSWIAWEDMLAAEGMPPELPQAGPRPRWDRDWSDHFGGSDPFGRAKQDANERLKLAYETTQDLFALLEDIRWGRHSPAIPTLTPAEHEVFDRYCDGLSFEAIAAELAIPIIPVRERFYETLSRFTGMRPEMKKTHRYRRVVNKS